MFRRPRCTSGSPSICSSTDIGWFSMWNTVTAAGWSMPAMGGSSSTSTRISRRRRSARTRRASLTIPCSWRCSPRWLSVSRPTRTCTRPTSRSSSGLSPACHGRSGYTMSLTNTDPVKTDRFPVFDWPRIDVPAVTFPLEDHLADVEAAEARALGQARGAFEAYPHDIACFIAEPIQGEGGDNHLRPEFLQAMQALCRRYDALFVLDEVQTGVGITGTPWAYQQLGIEPDIVAFGKKVQLGGIMAGRRIDEVPDNVFRVSSRINSTWGGGLVDMVRSRRILEIIEADGLFEHAARAGGYLLSELLDLRDRHPGLVTNVRGRGLMC